MYRRLLVVAVLLVGVTIGACRRESPEPPAPPPSEEEDSGPDQDSLQRIQDSIEAARQAELAAQREHEAAVAEARAILEERVHFDYDESAIRPDAEQVLLQKVQVLQASPDVRLRLEGHTDERGSAEYNQALGSRRAQSVLDFLMQHGISQTRFETTSFGEERPLMNQSTEQAWAQNRRVEFIITGGADQINPPE